MKIDGKELYPRPDLGWVINFIDRDAHGIYKYEAGTWKVRRASLGPPSGAHRRFLRRLRGDS